MEKSDTILSVMSCAENTRTKAAPSFTAILMFIMFICVLPVFSAMTIIESDDTAKVIQVEPAGTKWADKWIEGGYQYPMSFVKDKPFMASGGSALSSGWGYTNGPGTGAELRYTFSNQNSVSVGFLIHAQGQVAEIYVDDVLKATVDTEAPSAIDYGGLSGAMREVCAATGLSSGVHTVRIRNTGTHNYTASTNWDNNTTMYGGRGTQLVVDFIRTGDYAFGTVKGTILDGSGTPIRNARITLNSGVGPFIDGSGKTVNYSDGKGYFQISGLAAGTYTLTAKRGNLCNYSGTVVVTAGGTVTNNITYISTVNITRPRLMAPAIVARNTTLVVEVSAPSGTSGWSMTLNNNYKTIPLTVTATYGATKIWNGTRPGWQLTATIPASTPQELWNVTVANSGGSGTEYKSVKVVDTMDKSFYMIHMADTHCDTRFVSNPNNDDKFIAMLEEIDIINPTFLAIAGDYCQSPGITQAYDEQMIPIFVTNGNVPCFISRGNHECPVSQSQVFNDWFWETVIGQLTYSVKAGPVNIFCHDVMQNSSKAWLQSAYAASQADATDKVRILIEHVPSSFNSGWAPTTAPYPSVLLYGHGHSDQYSTASGYPQIETASGQNYRMRQLRFNRDGSGNWTLGSYGYNGGSGSMTTASSPTAVSIKRTFAFANNGTVSSNAASIVNSLAETFENGCARFIMPKGTYAATGGTIVDAYDSDDGLKTIVVVTVNIAKSATTSVTVCPVNGAPVITGALASFTTNKSFTVTLDVDKNFGYWSTNGTSYSQFTTNGTSILIDRTLTLSYYGLDTNAHNSGTNSRTYTFDTTAPTVTGAPANFVTNAAFTVTLDVNENYGWFSTNGSTFYQFTTSATNILIDRTLTLSFYGRDALGNTSTTNMRTYTVDLPPVVSGAPASCTTNKTFTIALAVDDNYGYWSTNGTTFYQFTTAGTTVGISRTTTLRYYGSNAVGVSATNSRTYTFDTTAPSVSGAPASFLTNRVFTVTLAVNENYGYVSLNGGAYARFGTAGTNIVIDKTTALSWYGRDTLGNTSITNAAVYTVTIITVLDGVRYMKDGGSSIILVNLPENTTGAVYSVSGRRVAELTPNDRGLVWDLSSNGRKASPGVYLCKLSTQSEIKVVKVMVQY
ncbi:MAG: carboxypeptidase regulatory-like domain-containing protein [Spirochaetes bacterium]|nr:carboxypeptidase regulatory-like domain-containing protein [Spirochaetota bacterium]